MSNTPTYTDLMANKLYMEEINAHLRERGQDLINQLADANNALLQQAKEIDDLVEQIKIGEEYSQEQDRLLDEVKGELGRARTEIRALKRQLLGN